jgi:hypothetical protein
MLFAYVLMDNHIHLVLRRMQRPLGLFMQRLLTGHSVTFNLRHERVGHLFQNRYKSLLCEDEDYLLELVRYVHLNPVRAGIVQEPGDFRWSSHRAYLLPQPPPWLQVHSVLEFLGGRTAYQQFVTAALHTGQRADLVGNAAPATNLPRRLWHGNQVLGGEPFVRRILDELPTMGERPDDERANPTILLLIIGTRTAAQFGLTVSVLQSRMRTRGISRARRALILTAVLNHGIRPIDVARFLGISCAAVSQHLHAGDVVKKLSGSAE